jgi:hypothetical protein
MLMRFLTLQLIANPTVVGTIAQTGGLVILAVTSILIWLGVRQGRVLCTASARYCSPWPSAHSKA